MWKEQKLNNLLKKELGNIILKELDISPGTLLTITRVECSPNLFEAKVYISVLPEDKIEEVFDVLKRNVYLLQQIINKKLRIRPVPKIIFLKETKTKEAAKIEEILHNIEKGGKN